MKHPRNGWFVKELMMKILIFIYEHYEHLKRNIHAREIKYLPEYPPEKPSYASNTTLCFNKEKKAWLINSPWYIYTCHSILSRLLSRLFLCPFIFSFFTYTMAAFHLTLETLVESFHPCYLSNVKQRQMMLASVKWNAAQRSRNDRREAARTERTKCRIVPNNKPPLYLPSRSIFPDQPSLFPSPSWFFGT